MHETILTPPPELILASASPRRRELLIQGGFSFRVFVEPVDEEALAAACPGRGDPVRLAGTLAAAKAEAVAVRRPDAVVLGADTIVVLDGRVFGKPRDDEEARAMLEALSGRTHLVLTAVCLRCQTSRRLVEHVETTRVRFFPLDDTQTRQIERYVAGGSPRDKAGAYGIQDEGALLVEAIEGDYCNVVGLPLAAVNRLLGRHFGIYPARRAVGSETAEGVEGER